MFGYQRAGGSLGLQGLFAPTNQSLLGALARISHRAVSPELPWAVTDVLGVLGVALAARVHFRWSPFPGVTLCILSQRVLCGYSSGYGCSTDTARPA